jgi:hypothetical protein
LVEDSTRVMLRLKALFRARAIPTPGKGVYHPTGRVTWLAQLPDRGARFRAEALCAELDALRTLRPKAKRAMLAEARRGAPGRRVGSSSRTLRDQPCGSGLGSSNACGSAPSLSGRRRASFGGHGGARTRRSGGHGRMTTTGGDWRPEPSCQRVESSYSPR